MAESEAASNIPANEVLGLGSELVIWREVQVTTPLDNLSVRVVRFLGAEWWPADETFEHDSTNTPPIAALVIASATKDLRCNVVWSTDSREGKLTTGFTPSVNLLTIRHGQLDLVDADRVAVLLNGLWSIWCHELLVVRCRMLLGESGR